MSTESPQTTMPAIVPQEQPPAPPPSAVATRPAVSFDADDPISLYMDSRIFAQLQRVAAMMAKANLVPAHLRGDDKISDCFLVAAQAFRWRMDPFSVAQHTFVTQGKLGYEGKLIAGLINASGRLETNLKPVYSGAAGGERKVTIIGRIRGEAEERVIDGTVGQWQTSNEKWKSMPDQMLFYRGAREWARRHMPEVMLGISAEEEIVEMERTAGGGFEAAPRTLEQLTEKLTAAAPSPTPVTPMAAEAPPRAPTAPRSREPGEDDVPPCEHLAIPAARIAATPKTKVLVCPDCGLEFRGQREDEPSAPQPDGPAAAAAHKGPRQGRLQE